MAAGRRSGGDLDDLELVARVLAGDTDAYAALVDRHRDLVYTVALRIAGNETDAEDIAQEAFVRAYKALGAFRGDSKFSSWLYRITVNRALGHIKRRMRAPFVEADADDLRETGRAAAPTGESPLEALLDEEFRLRVRQAIAELPPRYRAVVTLYHLEERSYKEAAAILGLPIGTVKTHLHRARAMLRKILAGE